MLRGTADITALAHGAPTIAAWPEAAVEFSDAISFQLVAELRHEHRTALLPPGLHPTQPPSLIVQAWSVGASAWGAFTLVTARLSCRSGVRARGFLVGAAASSPVMAEKLSSSWGYCCRVADVRLHHRYDGTSVEVVDRGERTLVIEGGRPRPLGPSDVQHTDTMTLAYTPVGLRLVQVEATMQNEHVDRLDGVVVHFSGAHWGDARLDPYDVVATTVGRGAITLGPVRFVCRPDVDAAAGTERVA